MSKMLDEMDSGVGPLYSDARAGRVGRAGRRGVRPGACQRERELLERHGDRVWEILTRAQVEALGMRAEGLTTHAIARALGIAEQNVRGRITRAVRILESL